MPNIVIRDLDKTRQQFQATLKQAGRRDAKLAFARALRHEGRKAYTSTKRALRKQTSIKTGEIGKQTRFIGPRKDNLTAEIRGKGRPLPLSHFGVKQFSYGVRAKVWGEQQRYPHAFVVGSLNNAFVRTSASRLPIRGMYGASVPREMIKEKTLKEFEASLSDVNARAMHELRRIMRLR